MGKNINLDVLQTKAKERTVKTQSIEYDLETLVKKIKNKIVKLDPEYQRRHRWNYETSSKLIESLILNIPIPIIYLSYDIDVDTDEEGARYSVIDGQQRLTAIVKFFGNDFPLEGLDILEDLNDCYYKDLPPFLLRRLEERTVKCLRIDSTIDPQVKYDIFERLNSGSVKLESHELRNAVLRGPFNDKCKELAKDTNFRKLLQIPVTNGDENAKVKKMEDVELVLRFFALFNDNYKSYKKTKDKQFKDFLSDELEKKNQYKKADIEKLSKRFTETMKIILDNFGDLAFAKYKYEKGKFVKQSNFNAAVYDALSVGVSAEIKTQKIDAKKVENFKDLFKNSKFHDNISGSILDTNKLIERIDQARKVLK